MPLAVAEIEVEGVLGMLLVLSELEDRCLREGVGCVAPVSWCAGFGSEISTGNNDAEVEFEECEAFEATEADWARKAVSSRERRFTCSLSISMRCSIILCLQLTTASCSFSHSANNSAAVIGRG